MKKKMLSGKVAVISGANSGIGLAIAKRLKDENVKVYDVSRTLIENPIFEKSFVCDISDSVRLQEVTEEIVRAEGKIDFLFCNAGFGIGGKVENASLESIDKIFSVNLAAHIKMTKLFLPYIKEGGKIIFSGSLATIIPLPYQACYSASKAGIEIFSRALATEVRDRKIKVTTFMPCDVSTNFTAARVVETGEDQKEKNGIANAEKSERNGATPDYIAKRVLKIVKKKNPPLRVAMGSVGFGLTGKLISFLVRIVPTKFLNFLVRKIYI
ncbi:MAG: SDR family NAD(P)-dependent oxidoreductase [Clostridia bacterium]|nr:SDR family NAD(P)-dependent oxidoreductase [Clostridia bacterium]